MHVHCLGQSGDDVDFLNSLTKHKQLVLLIIGPNWCCNSIDVDPAADESTGA